MFVIKKVYSTDVPGMFVNYRRAGRVIYSVSDIISELREIVCVCACVCFRACVRVLCDLVCLTNKKWINSGHACYAHCRTNGY